MVTSVEPQTLSIHVYFWQVFTPLVVACTAFPHLGPVVVLAVGLQCDGVVVATFPAASSPMHVLCSSDPTTRLARAITTMPASMGPVLTSLCVCALHRASRSSQACLTLSARPSR
jgi:hypothetical protein